MVMQRKCLKSCLMLTLLIFTTKGIAQTTVSKREILELKQRAQDYYEDHKFYDALDIYLQLDSLHPDDPVTVFHIGVCYLNFESTECLPYFEKCLENPLEYPPSLSYFAATGYHLDHQFDKAIHYYEDYSKYLLKRKKRKRDYTAIREVMREIEMCKYGKELVASPLTIEIKNMGSTVNTEYPEYGPVITADGNTLMFTSERPDTHGGHKDKIEGTYNEDIYVSLRQNDTTWTTPVNPDGALNSDGNDATIWISPDGQTLITYKYDHAHFWEANSGNLHISKKDGTSWGEPKLLGPPVNTSGWEPSACLSPDGNTMYFTSARKGGLGGTDIYKATRTPEGTWSEATNLGTHINTPFDEDCPFINADGKTIYFSSTGHESMGGYDIFFSEYNEAIGDWSPPQNIGYPINTAHDDIHFFLSADGRTMYFSSLRDGGYGDKDIYYANIKEEPHKLLLMKGKILDSLSNEPIEAVIIVRDNKTHEVIGIYNSNKKSGEYLVIFQEGTKYDISIEAEGYEICTDAVNNENLQHYLELSKDIRLCPKNR